MKLWPKVGSKIKYKGTHKFWFTNIVKDAEDLLEIGKEYTVSKIELASSWCGVIVEEFPDNKFALSFFEYTEELTTEEQFAAEGRPPIGRYEYKELSQEQMDKIKKMFRRE